MIRVLTFDPYAPSELEQSTSARRWALLYRAFVLGGDAVHGDRRGAREREDRAKEARVLRALKAISVDDNGDRRRLRNLGGELRLQQRDFETLERYVAAAPLPTIESEALDDLIEWIAAADKIDEPA